MRHNFTYKITYTILCCLYTLVTYTNAHSAAIRPLFRHKITKLLNDLVNMTFCKLIWYFDYRKLTSVSYSEPLYLIDLPNITQLQWSSKSLNWKKPFSHIRVSFKGLRLWKKLIYWIGESLQYEGFSIESMEERIVYQCNQRGWMGAPYRKRGPLFYQILKFSPSFFYQFWKFSG